MYFFMFVEWLIFCGLVRFSNDCFKSRSLIGPQIVWVNPKKLILKIFLVFQGMTFLPVFFTWVFNIEMDPNDSTKT